MCSQGLKPCNWYILFSSKYMGPSIWLGSLSFHLTPKKKKKCISITVLASSDLHIHSGRIISLKSLKNDISAHWGAAFLVKRMAVVENIREEEKIQVVTCL